jgi:Galactose oxidase, central domain/Kelch motif
MRSLIRSFSAVLAIGLAILFLSPVRAMSIPGPHAAKVPDIGSWSQTGKMHYARQGDTATVLADGKVLIVGGLDSSGVIPAFAEVYHPQTSTWSLTGKMLIPRMNHAAVLLASGNVLVAGGSNGSEALASAELYNPKTGTWSLTDSMHVARENFTATLLHNGEVLVTGGDNGHQPFIKALRSAELYNPSTGKWTLTGNMRTTHFHHTATLLTDGDVLIAGGDDGAGYASAPAKGSSTMCLCAHATATSELYNPARGTWSKTGNMNYARDLFMTAVIPGDNGKVLAAGGFTCNTATSSCTIMSSAEIYNPVDGTWALTASMHQARYSFIAARLGAASRQILVAGGLIPTRIDTDSAEIYNAATGTWSIATSMSVPCDQPTASHLANGQLLIAGGVNSTGALSTAEVFTP